MLMFDTVLTLGPLGSGSNNSEIGGAFGPRTLIFISSTQNLTFVGLNPTGGPIDKQVVAIVNITGASFSHQFAHNSGLATALNHRLLNPGLTTVNTGVGQGAIWYVYNGTAQRWYCLTRTV